MIPLLAMLFTSEVSWTLSDFLVMAAMLIITGSGIELAIRKGKSTSAKALLVAGIVLAFLLLWLELAVGLPL